jgi:WD40 repeat protein
VVRTLTGHRSNCTAVEFHPFGEFFASGSMDTNLKIWDIRKKGCSHTYKGHTRGISTIKFTPDGRWVVSGGFDNVVKVIIDYITRVQLAASFLINACNQQLPVTTLLLSRFGI